MLRFSTLIFLLTPFLVLNSQSKKFDIHTVAFYNVENLFDTINDRFTFDNDFTPQGLHQYTARVYWDKIAKLSRVLANIGRGENSKAPVIIGLCEVETKATLKDLINHPFLRQENYAIVHYDSRDDRGIDVALLYQKKHFKQVKHQVYTPRIYDEKGQRDYTRDQLVVSGLLDGERLYFIVNHWPSRRGGLLKSEPKRIISAKLNVRLIDSILELDPKGKILLMGDFNDDPNNKSIQRVLGAEAERPESDNSYGLFNPMALMFKQGYHSLVYRDNINLFDQIILSTALLEKDYTSFRYYKAGIFNEAFMIRPYGRYKGYPFRSFEQGNYIGGYSDHFPVYIYLIRESR